jgi:hypothetical protein
MKRGGVAVQPAGVVTVSSEQAQAMGLCTTTGDHEGCLPAGCTCGCHRLNPWPWEFADSPD